MADIHNFVLKPNRLDAHFQSEEKSKISTKKVSFACDFCITDDIFDSEGFLPIYTQLEFADKFNKSFIAEGFQIRAKEKWDTMLAFILLLKVDSELRNRIGLELDIKHRIITFKKPDVYGDYILDMRKLERDFVSGYVFGTSKQPQMKLIYPIQCTEEGAWFSFCNLGASWELKKFTTLAELQVEFPPSSTFLLNSFHGLNRYFGTYCTIKMPNLGFQISQSTDPSLFNKMFISSCDEIPRFSKQTNPRGLYLSVKANGYHYLFSPTGNALMFSLVTAKQSSSNCLLCIGSSDEQSCYPFNTVMFGDGAGFRGVTNFMNFMSWVMCDPKTPIATNVFTTAIPNTADDIQAVNHDTAVSWLRLGILIGSGIEIPKTMFRAFVPSGAITTKEINPHNFLTMRAIVDASNPDLTLKLSDDLRVFLNRIPEVETFKDFEELILKFDPKLKLTDVPRIWTWYRTRNGDIKSFVF